MRLIVIRQAADLKALGAVLLNQSAGARRAPPELDTSTLEQLKALNPHVDFEQVAAGTVLLLPDLPELRDAASEPLAGATFAELAEEVDNGMGTVRDQQQAPEAKEQVEAMRVTVAGELAALALLLK